ncbi:hypothetical protein Salat_1939600 [Sesamum alatum]|uniref:Uncharacterized protein n=1 Tax=Sesamum alatum TaxID=300844 RepID=A0AAE1Y5N1_9LAMI|nr:hypothetical protein Salat_1939600 [Sesamum alatum]
MFGGEENRGAKSKGAHGSVKQKQAGTSLKPLTAPRFIRYFKCIVSCKEILLETGRWGGGHGREGEVLLPVTICGEPHGGGCLFTCSPRATFFLDWICLYCMNLTPF